MDGYAPCTVQAARVTSLLLGGFPEQGVNLDPIVAPFDLSTLSSEKTVDKAIVKATRD